MCIIYMSDYAMQFQSKMHISPLLTKVSISSVALTFKEMQEKNNIMVLQIYFPRKTSLKFLPKFRGFLSSLEFSTTFGINKSFIFFSFKVGAGFQA